MVKKIKALLIWVGRLIGGFVFLLMLGALILLWVNRDLPMSELEQQYGGDNLQRVTIDGVNLAYKVEGKGPPLLLLHSHFYTMRLWQPWVEQLADQFTIIRFDLTSHGLTGPDPRNDYSRARGSELINGLLEHLHIEKTHIAGSSTGGAVAWYYAAHFPQKVDKLIVINAPGMPRVTNKYMEKTLPDWGSFLLYLIPESVFRPFLEAPVIDKTLISDELLHEFYQMYRGKGNRHAEYKRLQSWERDDIGPALARIQAPTLIMWGDKNPQLPVEHVQQFIDQLTNAKSAEQRIYPNIGHVIPLEVPIQSAIDAGVFLAKP